MSTLDQLIALQQQLGSLGPKRQRANVLLGGQENPGRAAAEQSGPNPYNPQNQQQGQSQQQQQQPQTDYATNPATAGTVFSGTEPISFGGTNTALGGAGGAGAFSSAGGFTPAAGTSFSLAEPSLFGAGGAEAFSAGGGFGELGAGAAEAGGGSLLSNPWAWLAAVVAGNELTSSNTGYRSDNPWKYASNLAFGKVGEQDLNSKFPDYFAKYGIDTNSQGEFRDTLGGWADLQSGAELATGDFGNWWEKVSQQGFLGKLFGGDFW